MMPLADVAALEARLGRTLAGQERTQAEAALTDASTQVRAHGLPWPDPATAPAIVVTTVVDAAERKVRNPDGYRSETQGAYSYQLPGFLPAGTGLTETEVQTIQRAAGLTGLFSVPVESLGGPL
ncbi:hypothetical protein [Streptomyces sp. MNP-20]|uniref:hypothetical protein n=1 Tax=Streptomyces sp. MNP-20 TaxID=2721165 RepID=UPI00155312A8|nr:hypothetical protein [Streptomyces sp. MNP-20]